MINRSMRVIATIAGYAVGFHLLLESWSGPDPLRAVSGLAMLFFVVTLGERPRSRTRK